MGRWLLAGVVLLVEYLVVSLNFDALTVRERGGSWRVIAGLGGLAPLGIAVAASVILLRGRLSKAKAPSEVSSTPQSLSPVAALPLLLHALLAVAFYAATQRIFAGDAPPGSPWLWLGLWGGLGLGLSFSLVWGLVDRRSIRWGKLAWSITGAVALGCAAWLAGAFSQSFWSPLSRATLGVVSWLLSPFPSLESQPERLSLALNGFEVRVSSVCSGFEGIGLILVLMSAYLLAERDNLRFPNALLILPLSVAAVWLGNAVRIAALMLIGAYVDATLAHGAFHSKAGWVVFCTIALGMAALSRRTRFWTRNVPALAADEMENPTAAYLLPFLMLLGVALFTSMFASSVDLAYPLRAVAAVCALYVVRRYFRGWRATVLSAPAPTFALVIGALVGVAWLVTAPSQPGAVTAVSSAFRELPVWVFAVWLGFRLVGSVVVVPLCEELAFRGYLLRWLVARDFTSVSFKSWTPFAVVASSLAFGVVHERWVAGMLAGAAYALVQIRSGRLRDAVVAHGVSNAVIAAWALLAGDWSHWL